MTQPNSVVFRSGSQPTSEVIRIDAQGFHYRGQFIEDAGEAHRLLVEFLRQHQPTALATEKNNEHPITPSIAVPTELEGQ